MFALCMRLLEEDGGVLVESHERYNKRNNCADINVYFKEQALRAVALPAHSSCVHKPLLDSGNRLQRMSIIRCVI